MVAEPAGPMLFNSIAYILFLLLTVGLYYLLPAEKRWILLLAGSLFCYGLFRVDYLLLLLFCVAVSYLGALKMHQSSDEGVRKRWLRTVLLADLGLLFVFKYLDFTYQSLVWVGGWVGLEMPAFVFNIVLPIGISFYIFQTIGYVVDVYWGVVEPQTHFGKFFLFVSFFPQLIAGPIEKAEDLMPQLERLDNRFRESDFWAGATRISWGLFKKAVVADNIALYTDVVFGNISFHQGATLYVALLLFAFQIYCDFSGYTDIAIGSARLLGINLSENFLLPYGSSTVREFWTRWHKTLYTWLYTYIYMPIAFGIPGPRGVASAVLATFFLSGLWHGASWNFIIFGLVHGFWVLLEAVLLDRMLYARLGSIWSRVVGVPVTFHVWLFSMIWFRTRTFEEAGLFLQNLVQGGSFEVLDTGVFARILLGLGILLVVEAGLVKAHTFQALYLKYGVRFCLGMMICSLFLLLLFGNSGGGQFIYFQF